MKKAIFTIVARNYLAQACVLMHSAKKHLQESNIELYVFVADTYKQTELNKLLDIESYAELIKRAHVLPLEVFHDEDIMPMFKKYNPVEFCTSIKPICFDYLRLNGFSQVLYLDPDIEIFGEMTFLFEKLATHSVVLTPHIASPIDDGYKLSTIDIQMAGVFNFGFLAFNFMFNETVQLNNWWLNTLKANCYINFSHGVFVDQKWGNLFPCFLNHFYILTDPGYNIAYWNLHERYIRITEKELLSNDKPVQFIHYSGFSPLKPQVLSKYQDRYNLTDLPILFEVFQNYTKKLLHAQYVLFNKIEFGSDFIETSHGSGVQVPEKLPREAGFFEKLKVVLKDMVRLFLQGKLNELMRLAFRKSWVLLKRQGLFHKSEVETEQTKLEQQADVKTEPEICLTPHVPACFPNAVNIVGYLNSELGIGESARGLIQAFDKLNIESNLYNFELSPSRKNETSFSQRFSSTFTNSLVEIIHVNADQVNNYFNSEISKLSRAKFRVGYWYWELEEFPETFTYGQNYFNEIWVATAFVKSGLEKKIKVPIRVIPPAIRFQPQGATPELFGFKKQCFKVLVCFDGFSYQSRKNPEAAIIAFRKFYETTANVNAQLIVKTINLTTEQVERLSLELKDLPHLLINDYLDSFEMRKLLATVDVYMSLHRAEGLGLNIIEAMFQKKPVIVTNYGGNLDYCNEDNSCLVSFNKIKIEKNYGPYKKGYVWAEPSVSHAANFLKLLYGSEEMREKVGARAHATVVSKFSTDTVSNILGKVLAEFGMRK